MASRFRRAFRYLMPSWLTTGEGEQVHFSLGIVIDAFAERWRQGVLARFPGYAPPDALAAIGRDRKLIRGLGESDEDYAARLVTWLSKHRVRGNPYALLEQVQAYLQAAVRVRTVDVRGNWYTREFDGVESAVLAAGNWDWDARDASRWSSFWLIIYPAGATDPWAITPLTIGDANLWGGTVGKFDGLGNLKDPPLTVGTTAEPEHISKIRTIVREWQPDGTRCEWIIIAFNSSSFAPTEAAEPLPNPGTWGKWGKLSGSDYVRARSGTHRYWRGMNGSEYP
jgi:hypothetical protein